MERGEEILRIDVLKKLKIIKEALPPIIRLVEKGKFQQVPHENTIVIDCLLKGVYSVNIEESKVIFRLCAQDLLTKNSN